jgi:cystathionine beta-lyase/cystathionine gamma-synthase
MMSFFILSIRVWRNKRKDFLMPKQSYGFSTQLIHAGEKPDPITGAIAPVLVRSKTFAQPGLGEEPAYMYSRGKNPTRTILEDKLAALVGGGEATVFSSGDAATTMFLLTLNPGDHILACKELYGGTVRLFDQLFARFGISVSYIDLECEDEVKAAMTKETVAVWVESPTNPKLGINDLGKIGKIAKKHRLQFVADLTFAPPCATRPFEYGIDTVIYSLSKYFAGHNDVIAGAVVTKNKKLHEQLCWLQWSVGACLSPDECYRLLQEIKTLNLRWQKVSSTADGIAAYLNQHTGIRLTYHPSLLSSDRKAIADKQMTAGYGSVVGFELIASDEKTRKQFVKNLISSGVIFYGESLSSPETIIAHPASMSHRGMNAQQRKELGINDNFFRLSVGLEDKEDIIKALASALSAI